jgi:hypothetical protein
MSLLTLVQDACVRLGITKPASAYGSADPQIVQLVGLAQQEGKELNRRHAWQRTTKEQTFTATATEAQASALPSDFDRYIDETMFNRTRKRHVYGPLTPQEWQFQKSVLTSTIVENWRQRGNSVMITPTATASDTYAFEYVSTNWCQSSGAVEQSSWAADTDTGLLSEDLMKLGVIWRFKSAKGFSYDEEFRNYELQVAQAIVRDGGKKTLNISRSKTNQPRGIFIQDGSWSV